MGTLCYDNSLEINDPCIIVVNDFNSPTGTWWGTITKKERPRNDGDKFLFEAKITDGRFKIDSNLNNVAINSNKHTNTQPAVNYVIYPDTEATRKLFQQLQQLQEVIAKARHWTKETKERMTTMTHLLRE